MSSPSTRSWIALGRHRLAAVMCLLMLVAGLFHTHADARVLATNADGPAIVLMQAVGEDAEGKAEAAPAHAASHCTCKDIPVPVGLGERTVLQVQPALFVAAASHALRPGTLAPPAKPPRA